MDTDLTRLFYGLATIVSITVPLAAWKLIEILVWLGRHVHITFGT